MNHIACCSDLAALHVYISFRYKASETTHLGEFCGSCLLVFCESCANIDYLTVQEPQLILQVSIKRRILS
jgi:hypothetical protein